MIETLTIEKENKSTFTLPINLERVETSICKVRTETPKLKQNFYISVMPYRTVSKTVGDYYNLDISHKISKFKKKEFRWGDKEYILKTSVICISNYKNNLWIFECPKYSLHSFSKDYDEALSQLDEEFAFLCNGLLNENDSRLTKDAIELRDILKKDIKEINHIM